MVARANPLIRSIYDRIGDNLTVSFKLVLPDLPMLVFSKLEFKHEPKKTPIKLSPFQNPEY